METRNQSESGVTPEIRREIVQIVDERIRDVHVTREDFSELKAIVGELAEAQRRTGRRMEDGFQSLQDQIAALGSRWGIYNEGTFGSTYATKEGIQPTLMVATSYISPRLMEKMVGLERQIEIFSYEGEE